MSRRHRVIYTFECILLLIFVKLVWDNSKILRHNTANEASETSPNSKIIRERGSYHEATMRNFLDASMVPNNFHYVWCEDKFLTFQHYISILSVIRFMRPDSITFLYRIRPETDTQFFYNTWLNELEKDFPALITNGLADNSTCVQNRPDTTRIIALIQEKGGIYITPGIVLTGQVEIDVQFMMRWDDTSEEGLIIIAPGVKPGISKRALSVRCPEITLGRSDVSHKLTLDVFRDEIALIRSDTCLHVIGDLYPKDIWERDDYLGDILRTVFYGRPERRLPVKNQRIVIPNIAHIFWYGGGEMNFLFYLNILSLVHIQKVERVYIHGDVPPSGTYWEKVKVYSQVMCKYRHFEGMQVFGNFVFNVSDSREVAHWSDVIRLDVLEKWGGIYIDTDAIFVKKLDDDVMKYDAVVQYSFAVRMPFPDSVVNGMMLARPHAEFVRKYLNSLRHYLRNNWIFNSLLVPYKIMERYPGLVKIDPHMHVMCQHSKCHPTWVENRLNMAIDHTNCNCHFNWKNDANAFHFCTGTCPDDLKNITALYQAPADSMFAQMGIHILTAAGLWDQAKL